jgi:hypothetical protein
MSSPLIRTLRVVVALVLAVAWTGVAFFLLPWLIYPAPALGWLYATAVFLLGFGVCALLCWGVGLRYAVGTALVASLVLGFASWHGIDPDLDRVRTVADDVRLPDGWTQVDEYGDEGSLFESHPSRLVRGYDVAPAREVGRVDAVVNAMTDQGWEPMDPTTWPDDGSFDCGETLRRGRWGACVGRGPFLPGDRGDFTIEWRDVSRG